MSSGARNKTVGGYGERVAAQRLVAAGMVVLDRNWRCDAGEIDLVLRDGSTLVVCEVKTRSSVHYGHPLEAVTPVKAARLRRLAARWLAEHDVHPARGADRPGRRTPQPARRRRGRAPRGGRLMVAMTRTVSLQGAVGHVVDVQVDLSTRPDRHRARGAPRRLDQRGAGPVPRGGHQQRVRLAQHASGDDPALARRPAQAGSALRPRDRGGRAGGLRPRRPPRPARRRGDDRRAHPRRPGALRARACCR